MTEDLLRACVESDGEIGIDFDYGNRDCITFSLSETHLGYSALIGEQSAYGRVALSEPLPSFIVDRLRVLLPKQE